MRHVKLTERNKTASMKPEWGLAAIRMTCKEHRSRLAPAAQWVFLKETGTSRARDRATSTAISRIPLTSP